MMRNNSVRLIQVYSPDNKFANNDHVVHCLFYAEAYL